MMLRSGVIAAAVLGLLASTSAQAEVSGPYLTGGVSGVYQGDRDVSGVAVGTLDQKLGYGIHASGGYQFRSGLRMEAEVAYRRNASKTFNNAAVNGRLNTFALMGNLIYEFDNSSGIYPYIGGGVGGARVAVDDYANLGGAAVDDDDLVFAYQGIAGVAFALNPRLSLVAEYKYFRTAEADVRNANNAALNVDYSTHSAMLGLRYRFGSAPRAQRATVQPAALPAITRVQPPRRIAQVAAKPAPAPLPVAQAKAAASLRRTYVVYFGLDSANLSPEARKTVADASARAKQDGTAVIELAGHTDRSGSASYNLALSQRRAKNTAIEIERNGVTSRLLLKGFGETAPQVATADGAYEPRNRRVEVVLQGTGDGLNAN